MNAKLIATALLLTAYIGFGDEYQRFVKEGLPAMLSFEVLDEDRKPVSGARLEAGFWFLNGKRKSFVTTSDTNGIAIFKSRVLVNAEACISKDGYYDAMYSKTYLGRTKESWQPSVDAGKWLPWNPKVTIILKAKKHPRMPHPKLTTVRLPGKNKFYDFDFSHGDLLPPFGKGEKTDILIMYESNYESSSEKDYCSKLTLSTTNACGGFICMDLDVGSSFQYSYEAPTNGYAATAVISRSRINGGKLSEGIDFKKSYLVFKVGDGDSSCGNFHFGIIHSVTFGGGYKNPNVGVVNISYLYNSIENDRDIEYAAP